MKKGEKKQINMSHDREEVCTGRGVPVPFLQDLGVMTQDGKIVHAKFDKFRQQINRFLEFIEDILPELDKGKRTLQSWILAVVNLISHLPCIII